VQTLTRVIQELKKRHYTILLVEQNLRFAANLADRMYVVEQGQVVEEIHKGELKKKMGAIEALLGV
jgi:branched-chain amino acid transport system ATP-binding protein